MADVVNDVAASKSADSKTAAPKPVAPKPAPPQPARSQKRGGGWFWFWVVVVVGGGGVGYLGWTQPEMVRGGWDWVVELRDGVDVPEVDAPRGLVADPEVETVGDSDSFDDSETIAETGTVADTPLTDSATINDSETFDNTLTDSDAADGLDVGGELAAINRRLDLMARNDDTSNARWRELDERVALLERQPSGGDTHLQLIDIALRASGDAGAAADALDVLAARADSAERRAFLLAESRRLRGAADRGDILDVIAQLRGRLQNLDDTADGSDGAAPDNVALGMVFSLLRVQKITTAKNRAAPLDDALARMEWLIVVGRSAEYLRELDDAAALWDGAKDKGDDGDVAAMFAKLQRLGAPDYKLAEGAR